MVSNASCTTICPAPLAKSPTVPGGILRSRRGSSKRPTTRSTWPARSSTPRSSVDPWRRQPAGYRLSQISNGLARQVPEVELHAGGRCTGSQISSGLGTGCGMVASPALGKAQSLESGFMLADAPQACGLSQPCPCRSWSWPSAGRRCAGLRMSNNLARAYPGLGLHAGQHCAGLRISISLPPCGWWRTPPSARLGSWGALRFAV